MLFFILKIDKYLSIFGAYFYFIRRNKKTQTIFRLEEFIYGKIYIAKGPVSREGLSGGA